MESTIPLQQFRLSDPFWDRLVTLARRKILPYQWKALRDEVPGAAASGCFQNFQNVRDGVAAKHQGFIFQDSDLYKWLEAAAYALSSHPDEALERQADEAVDLILSAAMDDGYINTYFSLTCPEKRFRNLHQAHELYCAGHLIEAAVAYYEATGKRKILDGAAKFADLICQTFGHGEGQMRGYPGHQEIEPALLRLYALTGEERYKDTAAYFLEERGREPYWFESEREHPDHPIVWGSHGKIDRAYSQSHLRPADQTTAAGHAVRAVYMYTAMAHLAGITEDEALTKACDALFDNIRHKQLYITGGIGSQYEGESFSGDYDLPPDRAYTETCASIGLMMFCRRMALKNPNSVYADITERALYNTVIGGVNQDGDGFFYTNPLALHTASCQCNKGEHHAKTRYQAWFGCACCPPNLARTLLSLGRYAYGWDEAGQTLRVDLYISGELEWNDTVLRVETDYPYGGTATLRLSGSAGLHLRSPADAPILSAKADGCDLPLILANGYLAVPAPAPKDAHGERTIELTFDLRPRLVYAHPNVRHTLGQAAVLRGPICYCAEEADNGVSPEHLMLAPNPSFEVIPIKGLPEGTPALRTQGFALQPQDSGGLYSEQKPAYTPHTITLIPFHLRCNRSEGDMSVFLRVKD